MTQEEKDLSLKDLCCRLPYGVMMRGINEDFELSISTPPTRLSYVLNSGDFISYLRPISNVTEEEVIEFNDLVGYEVMNNWIRCTKLFGSYGIKISGCAELIDWLNKHHFDYRGLIPMGLALEAPKDMYTF